MFEKQLVVNRLWQISYYPSNEIQIHMFDNSAGKFLSQDSQWIVLAKRGKNRCCYQTVSKNSLTGVLK